MNTARNEAVKESYLITQSYTKTAKLFGVSRQRIHQIVRNYKTVYFKTEKSRRILYFKIYFNSRQLLCFRCKKDVFANFHHKDKNPLNNELENLMPLCKQCHGTIHRKKNTDTTS